MTGPALLETRSIVAGYGQVPVLDGVSITARPSSITAVLGANGAGKTTLLRTIGGLVRPGSGQVLLDGVNVTRMAPERIARAGVAHVPEGQGVITELTVAENLRLGAMLRGPGQLGQPGRASKAAKAAALEDTYRRFPMLAGRRNSAAGSLSGGERQLLVIARALLTTPRALLLDEPSLGLAPKLVIQVMSLIRQLRDEAGLTILLVEQNAWGALAIADTGVVLSHGKVVAEADAASLAADDQLRRHYLGF